MICFYDVPLKNKFILYGSVTSDPWLYQHPVTSSISTNRAAKGRALR